MKTVNDFNFKNKKAIIRVDFNVPLDENFNVTDVTRIEAAKPTIDKILADGGSVILMSHLGRPKGAEEKYSLKHILKTASDILGVSVQFAANCVGTEAKIAADKLQVGEVLLLENLRFHAEEEANAMSDHTRFTQVTADQHQKRSSHQSPEDAAWDFGDCSEYQVELHH